MNPWYRWALSLRRNSELCETLSVSLLDTESKRFDKEVNEIQEIYNKSGNNVGEFLQRAVERQSRLLNDCPADLQV